MNKNSLTTTELYKKVLEIGADCTHCVVTYNYVKEKLCGLNCYEEELIDNFLTTWFNAIFVHNDEKCTEEKDEFGPLKYEEKHLKKCEHFLSPESILQLHQFETAGKNFKSSIIGLIVSGIALLISFGILCVQYSKNQVDYTKQLNQIITNQKVKGSFNRDNVKYNSKQMLPATKTIEHPIDSIGPKSSNK